MFQVPQMFFVSQSASQEQICIYRTEDKIRTWEDATSQKQLRATIRPERELHMWKHLLLHIWKLPAPRHMGEIVSKLFMQNSSCSINCTQGWNNRYQGGKE